MSIEQLEEWHTAHCLECEWSHDAGINGSGTELAARRHCGSTGHQVRLDRMMMLRRRSDASSELAELARNLRNRSG